MKKIINKLTALTVACSMLFSSANIVFGADEPDKLSKIIDLGIIQGEGEGIKGDEIISRYRGISFQLKLIGLWDEMVNYDYKNKETFTDAYNQSPYVKKLLAFLKNTPKAKIKGYPDGSFKPMKKMTQKEFTGIILSSLGYEAGIDFTWETMAEFAEITELVNSREEVTDKPITVNEAASLIYDALLLEGSKEIEGNFGEEIGFIIKDTRGPQISFSELPKTTKDYEVKLKGSIDELGSLKINEKEIKVDENLNFEAVISLEIGKNTVKTETKDTLGNISKKEFIIEMLSDEFAVIETKSDSLKMVKVSFNSELEPSTVKTENFKIKNFNIGKTELSEDKKSVFVMLAEDSVFNQQEEYSFEYIKDLKDTAGNEIIKAENLKFYVSDTEKPMAERVTSHSNNEILVKFTEPVKEELASDISNYELNGERFIGTIKGYDYNTIILHSTNLKSENELKIKNIRDFNNFIMPEQILDFKYEEDTESPEIEEISEITLESVKIKFNEKIDFNSVNKDNIRWSYSLKSETGKTATEIEKTGEDSIKVYFKGDNSLSPTELNIIVSGIKDLSGNEIKKDSYKKIRAEIDETKPEVKSLSVLHEGNQTTENNGTMRVKAEFTKAVTDNDSEVNFSNNFIIKDSTGNIIDKEINFKEYSDKPINIIEFTVDNLEPGNYTLLIKNLKDGEKYPNIMEESEHEFKVENKKTPEVKGIYFEDTENKDKIYIEFSEPMNESVKETKKYIIKKNGAWRKLSSETDTEIQTENNNRYAVIELNGDIKEYEEIEISFVESEAGNTINENKVTFNLKDIEKVKDAKLNPPVIKYAEITGKNQIKIYMNKELSDSYFKDFWITDSERTISPEVYHNRTSDLTFETKTVNENSIQVDLNDDGKMENALNTTVVIINYTDNIFTSEGKFEDGKKVTVTVNPEKVLHTTDMLGNKLSESSYEAKDRISASIKAENNSINMEENNSIVTVVFDEAVTIQEGYEAYAANDIVIKDNMEKALTPGIDYTVSANEGKLKIILSSTVSGNFSLSSSDSVNFTKDFNNNPIASFKNVSLISQ